ncbi:MAG TPA: hypothetical protein VG713_22190 [Pirellulales bacterium]|nr:hypothetical protein [Pirellulales bacterium]
MEETLLEYSDSRGVAMRVDRELGVLRGVKILGLESRNGRSYLPEALVDAVNLYEGAKVNVNHPRGAPMAPRDYQDRIGVVRHVKLREGEGLFGDFFFNPQHALAAQLAWDAEHAPENVGFSHNVQARLGRRGDQTVVEAITRVQSVDLVADPATTRGLFESVAATAVETIKSVTLEQLRAERPDLVEAVLLECREELTRLQREVDRFTAIDAARVQLLEELRAGSIQSDQKPKPIARDQHLVEAAMNPPLDLSGFVRAIT